MHFLFNSPNSYLGGIHMCQLLGLSFNQEISPVIPFSILMSRSLAHPDGWGLACYAADSSSAVVFKEPISGYDSQLAKFLCNYRELKSKIFIAHIRKATRGDVTYDNTHPFTRCFAGREYTFAHNGTLFKRHLLKQLSYQPVGGTDSERAFCYLLSQLKRYKIKPVWLDNSWVYHDKDFQIIHEILMEINTRTAGSFNCIFSDSKYLFCYRDLGEARYLSYKKCQNEFEITEVRKKILSKNSYIENGQYSSGYIVATEPLDNDQWESLAGGNLMVFKDGKVIANLY